MKTVIFNACICHRLVIVLSKCPAISGLIISFFHLKTFLNEYHYGYVALGQLSWTISVIQRLNICFISDKNHLRKFRKGVITKKNGKVGNKRQESPANRYCSCSTKLCNCCREFNLPVVALRGPGCATLQYLNGDRLAISMSFGERVLTNTTVSSEIVFQLYVPLCKILDFFKVRGPIPYVCHFRGE